MNINLPEIISLIKTFKIGNSTSKYSTEYKTSSGLYYLKLNLYSTGTPAFFNIETENKMILSISSINGHCQVLDHINQTAKTLKPELLKLASSFCATDNTEYDPFIFQLSTMYKEDNIKFSLVWAELYKHCMGIGYGY